MLRGIRRLVEDKYHAENHDHHNELNVDDVNDHLLNNLYDHHELSVDGRK